MMFRWISLLLVFVSLGMVCWAGYLWLIPTSAQDAFVIEEPERQLGDWSVGRSQLTFRITNQSDQPKEIIGLAEG